MLRAGLLALATAATVPGAGAKADGGEQRPGMVIQVQPSELPEPYATRSARNRPEEIPRPSGALPTVPDGFRANLFADGFAHARWMTVARNGDVFLAEPRAGRVTLVRDSDGDGRADGRWDFAAGFERPHGLAIHGGYLYVADVEHVWRVPYRVGETRADGAPRPVTREGALGGPSGHWTRNIVFSPDGSHFYVAIGSASNLAVDPVVRASVQEFRADGSGQTTFASGLRNPVGITFRPGTNELWVTVNERDGMGEELVPDYMTQVREGGFYGWPYAYIGSNPQPGFAERRPDLVKKTIVPDLLFRSHSAALGLVFYDEAQFPSDYRGDAFVALHGSWNAADPRGYFVARVPFEGGEPVGHYQVFASGFWQRGTDTAQVWGRPAGLAVAKDGSLLIADDVANAIWRVSRAE